jgi:hypothetical protein
MEKYSMGEPQKVERAGESKNEREMTLESGREKGARAAKP